MFFFIGNFLKLNTRFVCMFIVFVNFLSSLIRYKICMLLCLVEKKNGICFTISNFAFIFGLLTYSYAYVFMNLYTLAFWSYFYALYLFVCSSFVYLNLYDLHQQFITFLIWRKQSLVKHTHLLQMLLHRYFSAFNFSIFLLPYFPLFWF